MKQTILIIIVILSFACSDRDNDNLCFEALNQSEGNWVIDVDSIESIHELVEGKYDFWKEKGWDKSLIPLVKVSKNRTINIGEIRKPLFCCVRQYDHRSVMKVLVFKEQIEVMWCQDTIVSNNVDRYCEARISSHNKDSINNISSETRDFFHYNQGMNFLPDEYYEEFDYQIRELEIQIVFFDKSIEVFPLLVEQIATGYRNFINEKSVKKYGKVFCELNESNQFSIMKDIPFSIDFFEYKNILGKRRLHHLYSTAPSALV